MIIGDNMIQTIEVMIRYNIQEKIKALIIYPKHICYINDKKYQVSDSFLEELIQTFCLWKN